MALLSDWCRSVTSLLTVCPWNEWKVEHTTYSVPGRWALRIVEHIWSVTSIFSSVTTCLYLGSCVLVWWTLRGTPSVPIPSLASGHTMRDCVSEFWTLALTPAGPVQGVLWYLVVMFWCSTSRAGHALQLRLGWARLGFIVTTMIWQHLGMASTVLVKAWTGVMQYLIQYWLTEWVSK